MESLSSDQYEKLDDSDKSIVNSHLGALGLYNAAQDEYAPNLRIEERWAGLE